MINKSILILIIFFVFFQIDQVLSEESNNFSMEQNEQNNESLSFFCDIIYDFQQSYQSNQI